MGRQAFPIIGGLIGAAVVGVATGGTGTLQGYAAGFSLGAAAGGIAGSYIDPILIQGNKVGDAQLQVAAEGGARAIMFGRCCVNATCIIARGNRKVVKKKTSNGKGSSGSTENETVTWTFAIGLGEAIVGGSISRIWQDETLVYDVFDDGTISDDDNAKFAAKFRFYDGNESQLPDADLQVFLGDDTPYFRGTSYVVFPNFDLTQTGERIPVFKFEVLNGVSGIVDDLESLRWELDSVGPGLSSSSDSVTLHGEASVVWNVDMYISGVMETRDYANNIHRIGGNGRFVTADDSSAAIFAPFNIYSITISDPPQTYYVNAMLAGETSPSIITMDGSDQWKLSVQVAGNATITFLCDPVDGQAFSAPQNGSARCEIRTAAGGGQTITLGAVVGSLLQRAGLEESEYDVSPLTHLLAGVCIEQTVNGGDAVNSCIQPFFFDPTERERVLTFVARGADVVRTLTIDDLTDTPDVATRQNAIELPAKVHFYYQSPMADYATTKATSTRYSPQADSSGEGSVTAPVTFYDSDEPAQIAAKLHKVMWTEADGTFTWNVGLHCIDLIPTDVVGLYLRGIATRARITAIENQGTSLTLTLIKDRQSSYTSAVTGIPLPAPTKPAPTTMSKSVLAVLDIAALQDTDDALYYYTAISGATSTWKGAELQRSLDGGSSWVPVGQVTTDVTMGRLTVAMTTALREFTDTTNTVTVQLFDPANDLVAYSDTAFLQEQGAIAIQAADGSWEIMQYRDATDGGAGLWTLSHLQRGRLNTLAAAHPVGSLFVLLDNDVARNTAQTAWLGGTIKHRAVSFNSSSEDADVVTQVYEGQSQREWAPASASATFDGTYLYVYDIVARNRFGTEVAPIASVNFQGWRVSLTDGVNTVTAEIATGNSAHIASGALTTITNVTIAGINKFTDAGEHLSLGAPATVPAGTNTPVAVVNAGDA